MERDTAVVGAGRSERDTSPVDTASAVPPTDRPEGARPSDRPEGLSPSDRPERTPAADWAEGPPWSARPVMDLWTGTRPAAGPSTAGVPASGGPATAVESVTSAPRPTGAVADARGTSGTASAPRARPSGPLPAGAVPACCAGPPALGADLATEADPPAGVGCGRAACSVRRCTAAGRVRAFVRVLGAGAGPDGTGVTRRPETDGRGVAAGADGSCGDTTNVSGLVTPDARTGAVETGSSGILRWTDAVRPEEGPFSCAAFAAGVRPAAPGASASFRTALDVAANPVVGTRVSASALVASGATADNGTTGARCTVVPGVSRPANDKVPAGCSRPATESPDLGCVARPRTVLDRPSRTA